MAVADISKEDANTFAHKLLEAALLLPDATEFTVVSLLKETDMYDKYAAYNRTGCQRIGKAFKNLTHPAMNSITRPHIRCLGYNKDTKMQYKTFNRD